MNKQEAAEYLEISVRTLESHMAKGNINFGHLRGKTRPTVDFKEEDLQRFKADLETPVIRVSQIPAESREKSLARLDEDQPTGKNGVLAIAAQDFPALVAAIRNIPQNPAEVPISEKMALTLPEAAEISGFSEHAIRRAIKSGEIKVCRSGRSHKVSPDDLKAWTQKQFT
jgi:excisionase family DNA binding protein